MQETMLQPPRTIMEVFKMLPEGTLAEVIGNTLYMSPTPTGQHQFIAGELYSTIKSFVSEKRLGLLLHAPLDVYLDQTSNAVQPDLFFISQANIQIFDPNGPVKGVPDLMIEILSSGNSKHDEVRKKDLYEKFRVKEYWVIEPISKKTIGYTLSESKFILIGEFEGELKSVLLKQSFIF